MNAREEYQKYMKEHNYELEELGNKYQVEYIPEMASRLFRFHWWSTKPYELLWKLALSAAIVFLLLTGLWIPFCVFLYIFLGLSIIFLILSRIESIRKERNHIFYSLVKYDVPFKIDGWDNLIKWYIHTTTGYPVNRDTSFISSFYDESKYIEPEIRNSASWQISTLYEAVQFSALSYRNHRSNNKVHLNEVDEVLKPKLKELSQSFYDLIIRHASIVEEQFVVSNLECKVRRYKAIAEGAEEVSDSGTKSHADRTWKSTKKLLIEQQELLNTKKEAYQKLLSDYKEQIEDINRIASRVPDVVSKIRELEVLDNLSYKKKDIERLLDISENMIELK